MSKRLSMKSKNRSRDNLDYRKLDINSEYRLRISWVVKLFIQVLTTDKTEAPKRETKVTHDLKKTLHPMYHIRNASVDAP